MRDIGQLLMIGFGGTKVASELKTFIKESHVGGVILFKRNCEKPQQIRDLINALQDVSEAPLIVGVDEEGGRVSRLPKEFTKIPSMREIGKVDRDGSLSFKIGEILGDELSAVGINIDFAPVVDVSTNEFNPVIGDRAFASDPARVSELTLEFIRGLESKGVGACAKHFPGHGDTDVDSHKGLPILHHTRKRFDECEFIPFKKAAEAQVASMMIGHMLAPNLDSQFPSSISKRIVEDILRKEIGYDRLVFSDDLTMKGLADLHKPSESVWMTLSAGCDIAMISSADLDEHRIILQSLKRAAENGNLSENTINRSLSRIVAFKDRFCTESSKPPLDIIGCREHRDILTDLI